MISWVFLLVLAKPLSIWATRFGPFEYFTLILMAMVLIASVSQGNLVKGLIAGLLGMLVSMPGVDPSAGQPRLTFDWYMLNSGLKLLPVLIGIFAVSQIISDILDLGRKIERVEAQRSGIMMRLRDWIRHGPNMLRSGLIGTLVGILPGVGASIGSVIAYTDGEEPLEDARRVRQGLGGGHRRVGDRQQRHGRRRVDPADRHGHPGLGDRRHPDRRPDDPLDPAGPDPFHHQCRRRLRDDRGLPDRQSGHAGGHDRLGRTGSRSSPTCRAASCCR